MMRRWMAILAMMSLLGLSIACGGDTSSGVGDDNQDDETPDAGTEDTGTIDDTGPDDTGDPDAGDPDTGDPDAGDSDYDACEELACGDLCSPCPPDDTDCVAPGVDHHCDADGQCMAGEPECDEDRDACEGLECGDQCCPSDVDEEDCDDYEHYRCDDEGLCVEPDSSGQDIIGFCPDEDEDACEGRECGDRCCPSDVDEEDCDDYEHYRCDDEGRCVDPESDGQDIIGLCPDDEYDACEGLVCGDACNPCDPDDPSCVVPGIDHFCDDDGQCIAGMVECDDEDLCDGLDCGDSCCPPGLTKEECEDYICDMDGECILPSATSIGDEEICKPGDDPCDGLQCGESCQPICPPDDPNCNMLPAEHYCDVNGECQTSVPICPAPGSCDGVDCGGSCGQGRICNVKGDCIGETEDPECGEDDPCAGLECGDSCQPTCPPDDPGCNLLPAEHHCDADGECRTGVPVCPASGL